MKKLRWLPIALMVCSLGLTGCNKGNKGGNQGGNSGEQQQGEQKQDEPKVSKVSIAKPDETTVLDGSRVSLKATVTGDEGVSQKVTWSSSDSAVATVTNGVVNFLKVSEQKKVTITAASSVDETKKDSVEFTVEHSPFDLKNSRGNPDSSLFLEEGKFIVEDPQDVALIFADVYSTRWYVEAEITITELDKTDAWPKFGIMASERDDGFWTHEQSKNLFYYADTPSAQTTWTGLNIVPENLEATDWNWGGQLAPGTASPAMKLGEAFKMGLMRDGDYFYSFYGKATDQTLAVVGACQYDHFGENANYVWIGGWKSAVEVAEAKWLVGNEIDALYEVPAALALKSEAETVYLGNSYQIEVTTEGLWNRNLLKFESDNEEVATVNAKGLVTANATNPGSAKITVSLEGTEVKKEFTLNITDDLLYKVDLDGELNDAIWSNTVKTNAFLLKRNDNNYIKFYGAKNSRGLYIFADYNVEGFKDAVAGQWWMHENFEFYLADNDMVWGGQYWVSSMNGGSFVSVGSGEKAEAVYYKALTEGEDHLLHGAFELFVPFGDDNVTKDEETYIRLGSNPKAGWYSSYNWESGAANVNMLRITANGFAHDDTSCSEGHVFGDWITDVAATCSSAGEAHRDCRWCGHRETKTLEIDPLAHNFDYEHAIVATPATCTSTGTGTATCTLCGATEDTLLPCDYTNHTDAEFGTTHAYCHDCGIGSHLNNPAGDFVDHNFGGWDNPTTWSQFGVWSGDFTLELEFHMNGCLGGNPDDAGSCCWRTVLPILYTDGFDPASNRHCKVFRMDWFGWIDGGYAVEENNGSMPGGFDWGQNYYAFSNMDVELTIKKVGANVTLDWVWTCLATEGMYVGQVYEYHQSAKLADASQTGVGLTAEWTTYTITRADFSR